MPALDDLHTAILAAVSALSQSREIVSEPELVAELRKVGRDDASELVALRIAELYEDGLLRFRRSLGLGLGLAHQPITSNEPPMATWSEPRTHLRNTWRDVASFGDIRRQIRH